MGSQMYLGVGKLGNGVGLSLGTSALALMDQN